MNITQRFDVARQVAQPILERGNYRWIPSTTIGWVVRIACTDVGQGAWVQAKNGDFTTRSSLSQDVAAQEPCETD